MHCTHTGWGIQREKYYCLYVIVLFIWPDSYAGCSSFTLGAEFVVFMFGADFVSLQSIILLMSLRRVSNFTLFFGSSLPRWNIASSIIYSQPFNSVYLLLFYHVCIGSDSMLVRSMCYRQRLHFLFASLLSDPNWMPYLFVFTPGKNSVFLVSCKN